MQLPQPGQMFEGKYVVRQMLGEGGFAVVYRATDAEIQRDVAIKILTPREGAYPKEVVARFMREARVIAGLQDPHTIKLFEFGESSEGLLYMVFQFVSGLDLQTILHRRGPLPPEVVIHVIAQVLSALAEAHAAGVLHRDIKPANVLIHEYMGDEYAVKLLDFGIAKVDERQATGGSLTKTGALLGTPRYMSPEQVFGEQVGPYSDIYSLGLVAYEMLVGEPAIGGSKEEMLRMQVSEQPLLLPYDVGWLPLRQTVERMLARAPADRFQTALQAHKALRFAMKHQNNALPSGQVPTQSSGPIAPLPYSSGIHTGPAAFSSGHVTPHPDFSSGQVLAGARHESDVLMPAPDDARFSSGYSSADRGRGRTSRGIVASSIALAVVVAGVAVYLSVDSQPPPAPPKQQMPTALLAVEEASATPDPAPPPDDAGVPDLAEADLKLVPAVDGCGNQYRWQYERWMEVERRPVQVFLPRKYQAKHRYPVIIALQPAKWDVKQYVTRSELVDVVGDEEVIVLGPAPTDRFSPWSDPDDMEMLKMLVPRAAEQFCIDRSRVFVVGTGAGGRMARELACEIELSGVATTGDGELVSAPSCPPQTPVPLLWIIGKQDYFSPIKGGTGCNGGEFLSADEHDEFWRTRNQCSGKRERWLNEGGSECWTWACDGAAYGACRAAGGHYVKETSWDVLDNGACKAPTLKLPVGPTAWKFFETHGKSLDAPDIP